MVNMFLSEEVHFVSRFFTFMRVTLVVTTLLHESLQQGRQDSKEAEPSFRDLVVHEPPRDTRYSSRGIHCAGRRLVLPIC